MKKTIQKISLLTSLLLITITCSTLSIAQSGHTQRGTLSATVDRASISEDETLQLSIVYTGEQKSREPDTTQLETLFDILSRNQSSRVQYVNGEVNSSTQWSYTLGPKLTGKLIIPSFQVEQAFSEAIEISVNAAQTGPNLGGQDVYIETSVNKESVYVQEQIVLTQRLYIASSISADQLDPQLLQLENVVFEELPSAKYTKNIGGQPYYVFEYSSAIFPQSSTTLVIPSLRWNLRVSDNSRSRFGSRFGSYKTRRLKTQEKVVEVKAKPSSYPAGHAWLPATNIQLEERWSKDANTFQIGEPITRTITINANGLTSSQLPQFITDSKTPDVKLYIDQAQLEDEQKSNGILGKRIESAAIVVTKNGKITIPATRIPWWNTTTDTLEYLELAEKVVSVEGTLNVENLNQNKNLPNDLISPENINASSNENESSFWKSLSIISIVFNLLLAIGLLIAYTRKGNSTDTSIVSTAVKSPNTVSWKTIEKTLKNNDLNQTRTNILAWQKNVDAENFSTIDETIRKHSSRALRSALGKLDKLLYAKDKSDKQESINEIITLLEDYKSKLKKQSKSISLTNEQKLASLHPSS